MIWIFYNRFCCFCFGLDGSKIHFIATLQQLNHTHSVNLFKLFAQKILANAIPFVAVCMYCWTVVISILCGKWRVTSVLAFLLFLFLSNGWIKSKFQYVCVISSLDFVVQMNLIHSYKLNMISESISWNEARSNCTFLIVLLEINLWSCRNAMKWMSCSPTVAKTPYHRPCCAHMIRISYMLIVRCSDVRTSKLQHIKRN